MGANNAHAIITWKKILEDIAATPPMSWFNRSVVSFTFLQRLFTERIA
jgi:hypothetical protein